MDDEWTIQTSAGDALDSEDKVDWGISTSVDDKEMHSLDNN